MPKRSKWAAIKIHRNYTMDEVARALSVAKGTVARWIKSGHLSAIKDHRPFLILGKDLADFRQAKKANKQKCGLAECYCFTCRAPREAAGRMAEYWCATDKTGHLRALCATCNGWMNKRFSLARLHEFHAALDLTNTHPPQRIMKGNEPCLNAHL